MIQYGFKNTILIVVFNFSNCLNNKEFIYNLYKDHFKTIVFYSDLPAIEDDEVNFINILYGNFTHRIFKHFYNKYKKLVDESDGIFYTMDDNIINVNILNLYSNQKILYYHKTLRYLHEYSGWQWDLGRGKYRILHLKEDDQFKTYNLTKYAGSFSDWFYLPKKYLTDKLFNLLALFGEYEVHLEISIPTIINNIENDKKAYNEYITDDIQWDEGRQKLTNKNYIYNSLNHDHNLLLHPIKFNMNPETKQYLHDIFCKKKCTIITTINEPTEAILKHIDNSEYDVIIVGDIKTPDVYKTLNCIFLDVAAQKKLFPDLCELLPYNHYSRKNLGYLYAIRKGYDIIYETDDDNIPKDNFDDILKLENYQIVSDANNQWINIYSHFTDKTDIWPRGLPINMIKKKHEHSLKLTKNVPALINGLVENDPDVDALYRLTNENSHVEWKIDEGVLIDNINVCVFNSQNTFWLDAQIFPCLLIPATVSFRYCDILRAIISNIVFRKMGKYIMYASPNVVQIRNDHDLISDLKSEMEMYIHNVNILDYLVVEDTKNIKQLLLSIYNELFHHDVIKENDIKILETWLQYF
jgi:hypothetical protein